nr:histone-like nucleoid-structuring protein Lsr2 [Arthrobacter sp. ISL-72]
MLRKSTIILIEDADGGAADERVAFALDETSHEIYVSISKASSLRSLLAPYIPAGRRTNRVAGTAGRKSGGRAPGPPTPAGSGGGPSTTGTR